MHAGADFLQGLALVLCVAAFTTVVCQRLGLPVVVGYLLAGMVVSDQTPGPRLADPSSVHTLSELGVILLMFSLGLDFSLRRLVRAGLVAGLVALVETSLMLWLGSTAAQLLGWQGLTSLFAGAMVAISSTTIVVKSFAEQPVPERLRELTFGVLIGEDLIAVVLIATLTALASGTAASTGELATTVGRLGGFLLVVTVVGMLIVPRLMRAVARLRAETLVVTSVGLSFAFALLAQAAGYSVALGAFLAGALVGESGVEREVERLVRPVRDVFAAVFFVSIGMLVDPTVAADHAGAACLLLTVVLVGKVASVGLAAFLAGQGVRTAVQAGMSLAQIGEFSFIIVAVGVSSGAVPPALYSIAITVSAATALLTPWLIRHSPAAAARFDARLPKRLQTFAALYATWIERLRATTPAAGAAAAVRTRLRPLLVDALLLSLVVVGAALEGPAVADWLSSALPVTRRPADVVVGAAAALLALPFVVSLLRTARALGTALGAAALPIPPAGQVDLADAPRRAMVVGLQVAVLLLVATPLVAATQSFVPPVQGALTLGVVLAIGGVDIWRRATTLQAHTRAAAEVIVELLARQLPSESASHETLLPLRDLLPGLGDPVPLRLSAASHGVGRTLAALDLRGLTGATVLAIVRDGDSVTVPTGNETLRAGDVLALAGPAQAIEAARALLLDGPQPAAQSVSRQASADEEY